MGVLRSRLVYQVSKPWEGETLMLKVALIQATENWKTLTGVGVLCPVVFDTEDGLQTMKLDELQCEDSDPLDTDINGVEIDSSEAGSVNDNDDGWYEDLNLSVD
jgi:hypothetical protein